MSIDSRTDGDRVRIYLRDCAMDLRVGAYPSERHAPQPILINLELEAAALPDYRGLTEKNLDQVIDYQPIYDFIRNDLPQLGHIPLLETVAEHIVDVCFRDARVEKVRVRLEKPNALPGAYINVEITRTRRTI